MIEKVCEHTFIKKLMNKNSVVLDLGANLQIVDQWTIEFHDFLYPETNERVEKIKRKFIDAGFFYIPFSITNNGDALFIKNNKISILEYFYLKYIFRYLLGLNRRLNKLFNDY